MQWKVERQSMASGITRTKVFEATPEQVLKYERGELIQNCFPHLSPDDREFIMTGITPEEWDEMFPDEEYFGVDPMDDVPF